MILFPTQSFTTVVGDDAAASVGTRSPATKARITKTFSTYVLLMSPSFIENSVDSMQYHGGDHTPQLEYDAQEMFFLIGKREDPNCQSSNLLFQKSSLL
jgi:hypothetical protein